MAVSNVYDEETKAVIYEGVTISQLARIFKAEPKTVTRKVSGLLPIGRRRGSPIYSLAEAAARLVKPSYSIERYISQMNHTDLPPLLQKEFWNGLRARQTYEAANADLWPTQDVVRAVSEVFNTVRMRMLLLPDTLQRESGLSPEQKIVVRQVVDAALTNIRDKTIKRFKEYGMGSPNGDERSGPIEYDYIPADIDDDAGTDRVLDAENIEDEYCGL